ncbi:hypothetical protein BCR32DRAFT_181966, partial [Anaeromyces robustus]
IINTYAIWQPKPGTTWNYVLKGYIYLRAERVEVLDVDLHKRSEEDIKNYHDADKKVICYFSGGTLEDRPDKDEFYKVEGLVNTSYNKLFGNYWLDIRKEGLKPILKERMKLAVEKKCDGIEVDNIDGYENEDLQKTWSNPLTKQDAINFAKWLSATAHELDFSIGLKNSLFMIDEVGDDFEFAINENCVSKKENNCYLYKNFLSKGKAVFAITYLTSLRKSLQGNNGIENLCNILNDLNLSMIIK